MSSEVVELQRPLNTLPRDWREGTVGDLFAVSTPGHWGDEPDGDGNILVLRSTNFRKAGGLIYETAAPRQFDDRKLVQKRLRRGDIIVERSGGSPAQPVGRARRFDAEGCYSASNFMQIMRTTDGVDDWFACYLLDHIYDQGLTEPLQRATTGIRNLDFKSFLELPISTPPLDEQRRIAEVLRSVDEAITSADHALSQTKLVRQNALDKLLSPVRGQTKPDRVSCRLGDVLSIAHGFAFKSEYFTANRSDPILLTPGNFSVEKTLYFGDRTKHYSGPIPDGYILEDGDLVVVMTDLTQDMAILGNAVEISGDSVVLHNQRIGRVSVSRPDLIVKGFARLLLNSTAVQSRVKATASGSTVRHTAPSRILECEVQLPKLDEQARIVAIARSLDDIVDTEQLRRANDAVTGPLSHLRSLKALIAGDLLSGRVRVPA